MKTKLNISVLLAIAVLASCTKEINHPETAVTITKNEAATSSFFIGQSYGGGVICFIDTTGLHGLIASVTDMDNGNFINWSNGADIATKATAIGLYRGGINTDKIINAQGDGYYAAAVCRAYNAGGFTDWSLPTKRELRLLLKNHSAAGLTISRNGYWSSTETDAGNAWILGGSSGLRGSILPKWIPASVRAVRYF